MAGKSDKEKNQSLQEKHQAILNDLLKEKCNTYCVDCNCKGPRWASWNLGVFLCIRCAGIHRNLGVHISRVKSVNLDSWTTEQIAVMQQMGNSNAKCLYEATLPTNFPIPQTDSALEALIRAKYEHKKYMVKDWSPSLHKVQSAVIEPVKKKKHRNRSVPPSRRLQTVAKSEMAETSPTVENEVQPVKDLNVELLTLDFSEAPVKEESVFEDLICSNDSSTVNPVKCDSDLLSSFATLALLDPTNVVPDQSRLANNDILALYGPSKNTAFSGVPGGMYIPMQNPALFGAYCSDSLGSSFSGFGSAAVPLQTTNSSGIVKCDATPVMSMLPSSAWTQPSTVGRTLCTSLWQ